MLDGLERDGIVSRKASQTDRRAVALRLTPAGVRVARAERARLEAKRAALFEALVPEERAQAARLLDRLADVLEDV
jgi:DNA-binding MarR family transcriptional regulator